MTRTDTRFSRRQVIHIGASAGAIALSGWLAGCGGDSEKAASTVSG